MGNFQGRVCEGGIYVGVVGEMVEQIDQSRKRDFGELMREWRMRKGGRKGCLYRTRVQIN